MESIYLFPLISSERNNREQIDNGRQILQLGRKRACQGWWN